MPVRKATRRPVRRLEKMVEEPVESIKEVRHHHNMVDLKVAVALALVVVSSMVINVYAQSPIGSVVSTTSTPGTVPNQAATLVVSPTVDSTTASKILVPSNTPVQVAKWSVSAENEPVRLQRVRFNMVNADYTVRTSASEFGTMSLYAGDGVTLLGQAVPVSGYVEFSGFNLDILPGQPQTLSLRSVITGSGIMKPNSMVRFGINQTSRSRWQASGVVSGASVVSDKLVFNVTVYGMSVPTSLNLFHNTAPVATSGQLDPTLEMNSQAKIFKFTLSNPGDREMRISRLMVKTTATGLNNSNNASSTTGFVSNFKLYEANSSGSAVTLLASAGNCLVSPTAFGPKLGTVTIPGTGTCSLGSVFVNFDQKNDLNNLMDNFIISPGSSRTMIMVADTTNMFKGKKTGSVTLNAQLSGSTGIFPSSDPKQAFWAGGGIYYHYKPINGIENLNPYNQSDSYSVIGPSLVRSL